VAKQYLRILTILGVETSPSKTYISSELCEFAKRLTYQGEEITPFPISSISDQWWSIPLVVAALRGEERKGFLPLYGVPRAVRALQEFCNPKAGKVYLSKVFEEALLCELGTKLLSGEISARDYFIAVGGVSFQIGVEDQDDSFDRVIMTFLSYLFQSSLKGDGSPFAFYDETEFLHLKSCGSLDWPEFEQSFPVLHVLVRLSKDLFSLESNLGRPFEKSDTWRDLIKWMYNPFAVDLLGTDNPKRSARVSHRLGRLVRKATLSPEYFSQVLSDISRSPLQDRGLILTLRSPGGLRDQAVFRVDHDDEVGLSWDPFLGK
jgi:hypothetical protein